MTKKLFVVIGCDTDPLIEINEPNAFIKENVWDETIQSIVRLKEKIGIFEDKQGLSPKITWFLRSDQQINIQWNDWCYPVREYISLWNEQIKSGDEIGWHPHLWRYDELKNIWYQEINDNDWISSCLENGYHEISKLFRINSVKMGWCFHKNYTMNLVDSFGIKYDLSAIPGLMNSGNTCNIYDWKNTSADPYFPSKKDYRIRDDNPSNNHNIMEIPITNYTVPFFWRIFISKRNMAANIAKHPIFFRNIFNNIIWNQESLLNTYFHPCDIGEKDRLFSLNNFERNLNNIIEIARKKKLEVVFITPQEFGEKYCVVGNRKIIMV
ncbi:MAG: hypothetical protein MPEBLZ_01918 [Candidatus Methanoperedens nitroreducens]|uniref:Polysaccharide deacetylase n=1 Tax=Candidatus Methanoperedens nitratireducens TaxID=1392998 RepID=A0A0P7ZIE9_9EURY|nr:hypothetical protein [Candidatus Methanoperedens sp. BLZ2]KAB2946781.1 MAG: hypothetical protein F9K14_06405 [Candidatus Methanoperedens sp.]KPQ43535.1 MAG: hypothetical protein MPEBLZ_01918 [Candidatus Methanoperedens sp. BLZ1]MBZ0175797.1 hypothetical protein [Candidatus Methanoperedens nitroreducens]MCX9079255.1 hypothetical protein [Candidatus Methanoperedens sp.]